MLTVRNLEVVYNAVSLVLRGVSLDVDAGSVTALLGANGAGKTTPLRAIIGLLVFHRGLVAKGSIEFDGRAVMAADTVTTVRAGVGTVSYEGVFGDYTYGAPEDRKPPRSTTFFAVDPDKPWGLAKVAVVESDQARAVDLSD
ncbi:MAG: hypothetical protein DI630_30880 [Gordonia sp. (in: high G+C Gram-positive bacteria)]|nr:MAG: hypothetical protein DI630_30880 [Gordonia sp. (in: high G+C Gram-positive bacteria)]